MSEVRLDRAFKLGATPVVIRDNGWREYVGTAGFGNIVQQYPDLIPPRAEFRPADEALSDATLASAEGVPVTEEHPNREKTPAGLLIPETTRDHVMGAVIKAWAEGEKFRVRLIVYSPDLQREIEDGTVDLSLGYTQDSDPVEGTFGSLPYQAVQRNVRINHLAVVRSARAVRPDGERARLDAESQPPTEHKSLPYPLNAGPNMDEINIPRTDAPALSEADQALVDQLSGPVKQQVMDLMAAKPEVKEEEDEMHEDIKQDKALMAPLEDRIAALEELIKSMKDAAPMKTPRTDAAPHVDVAAVLARAEQAAEARYNVTAKFVESVRVDGHKAVTTEDASAVMLSVIAENLPGLAEGAKADLIGGRFDSLTRVYKEAERIRSEKLVQRQAEFLFPNSNARADANPTTFEVPHFDV